MENNKLSYELLERIVNLRFVCRHLSHWLIECYGLRQMDRQLSNQTMKKRSELITDLHRLCLKPGYEALHLFFLKNIYHELGTDALRLIISNNISWILLDPNMGNMIKVQKYYFIFIVIVGSIEIAFKELSFSQIQNIVYNRLCININF